MEKQQNEQDLESLPLADIKRLAEEEAKKAVKEADATPRNEKGQFISQQEADSGKDDVDPDNADDEPKLFRRVIDIGDGAGPEIFEASTLEELIDKIADAKGHATKKIRSQEEELRKLRPTKEELEKEPSADEEFILSQEMLQHPTKAISKMFKNLTGYDIKDFATVKQRMDAVDQKKAADEAATAFIVTHPDFVDSPKNGKLINYALKGAPVTPETLHKAYLELKDGGLLELKDKEANAGQEEQELANERIASTRENVKPTPQTKRESGLSTRNRPTVPSKSQEPSEDDLYSMPLDQLRTQANKSLAR